MRRIATCLVTAALATSVAFAEARFVDRDGTLWTAAPTMEGLRLTGTRNGEPVASGVLPVMFAGSLRYDQEIQVIADEVTGKVAVVWQREWAPGTSEIRMAVWSQDAWEQVLVLSEESGRHPRYPVSQLARVTTMIPAEVDPGDSSVVLKPADLVQESFMQVVWWEDGDEYSRARMAIVRMSADHDDPEPVIAYNLDLLAQGGEPCGPGYVEDLLERPLFSSRAAVDRGMVFFGSERTCRFNVLEITFPLEDPDDPPAEAQRRRHRPVFGVRDTFDIPVEIRMAGARVLVAAQLKPVVYRVLADAVEFFIAGEAGWSSRRTLPLGEDLDRAQAVLLMEDLAR